MRWAGFTGAPGYSIFHFRDFASGAPVQADADQAHAKVESFIDAIRPVIPNPVLLSVMPDVEIIEETTAVLQDLKTVIPNAPRAGSATAGTNWAAAVGANITWRTGGIRNGRRVKGRTFLVPLAFTAFHTDGTLNDATHTTLNAAATTLRSATGSPDLGVWARPSAIGASDGAWFAATGHSIPDISTVLRSRRN